MGEGQGVLLEAIRREYGDRTWREGKGTSDHVGKVNLSGTTDGYIIIYVTKYGYSLVSFRPVRRVRNTNALLCGPQAPGRPVVQSWGHTVIHWFETVGGGEASECSILTMVEGRLDTNLIRRGTGKGGGGGSGRLYYYIPVCSPRSH